MEESEDNKSVKDKKQEKDTFFYKIKSKKRSLVERELETNLTERVTSPIIVNGPTINTSRYGRARRLKTDPDYNDTEKVIQIFKSPLKDKSPIKSPVYKMHASNSPIRVESPSKKSPNSLEHQIESIYIENISLSRFTDDNKHISPAKQSPKVYVRKDLIQTKEKEETITLIKHYSPKSNQKSNTHLNNVLQRSSERYSLNNDILNGYVDNTSVVKTLDFDGNKKKKIKEGTGNLSKSDIFELEAKCEYQVGDLAWAKMGTFPYWPCIVTRDPFSGMFVKKKLFGRIDRDVIHVTFFGDNGRRSWIVDNMLRKFLGQLEFEAIRDKFTPEAKKKDPRCAAFFVSEKKLPQWTISVEEAETLLREPKRLRIDLLNDMLNKARTIKTVPKGSKKVTRTDSDVSLSESLYDTLFSEDDTKTSDIDRTKNKTRNKSLDVSEVVTACLDNMAAKTGITKIQKQSHMDRWLQKAKSKTPEKSQLKSHTNNHNLKQDIRKNRSKKIKREQDLKKSFRFTISENESLNEVDSKLQAHQNEHDYSMDCSNDFINYSHLDSDGLVTNTESPASDFGNITKVESLSDKSVTDTKQKIGDSIENCDNIFVEQNGINNIIINNVNIIEENEASDNMISSAIGNTEKNLNEMSMKGSKTHLMYKSNIVVDEVNYEKLTSPNISTSLSTPIADAVMCETDRSYTNNETQDKIFLKGELNTHIADLQIQATNRHDKVKDIKDEVYSNKSYERDRICHIIDSNEKSVKDNINEHHDIQDNTSTTEVQEKQDVNITKTILSDKFVGHNVDFNKIDLHIKMNETPFIVNDDCNLKIPETNGLSNTLTTIDDCNKDSRNLISPSDILESNHNVNSFPDGISKIVHNEETTFTFTNNPLMGSGNDVCTDTVFLEDSLKENNLDHESMTTETFSSKKKVINVIRNGFASETDEMDPTINCISYLSSEEDDGSVNSTPTDVNEFSNLNKCKTKYMKNNYKDLSLQDALVLKDVENRSDLNNQEIFHDKFIVKIDALEESNRIRINSLDEINKLSDTKQNTTEESDHCLTDSNDGSDKMTVNYDSNQINTEGSEGCSTYSNHTCDSDNKSFYNDAQTETTVVTETSETNESIDVDESTFDSLTQNGYESIKVGTQNEYITGHETPSEEKAIVSGDELRLTSHGLEILNENCVSIDDNINTIVKAKNSLYIKDENDIDVDTASIVSTDSEKSLTKMHWKVDKTDFSEKNITDNNMRDPDFLKYLEFKQDAIYDEHPELSQEEITMYLYNTWLYEESLKTDRKKTDDIESANLVKGLQSEVAKQPKKVKKRIKVEKVKYYEPVKVEQIVQKKKPKRRTVRPSYNEDYTDVEEDLEVFGIPKLKELNAIKMESENSSETYAVGEEEILGEIDEVEEYFARLTDTKPNVFKGLLREKICEICEKTSNLVKCKGCCSMFHMDCVKKETKVVERQAPMKGRKKKKKFRGRKSKTDENGLDECQSDEKDANISEEIVNNSMENIEPEPLTVANVEDFEAQLAIKMKELLGSGENAYNDTFSSADELNWSDTEPGKCEIVDIKLRKKGDEYVEYSDFKCNNCQKYDVPICFVCRSAESPKNKALHRQKCQVPQCNKYFHLECLEHWPQTQFNSGETRYNKKVNEFFEALTCPRHVCHTCVSDDPRGCKTRFCGDKLARCVRCPATYHTFTKCLPAGSQILTGSHIICPRHHEHRPGKNPCHVNTGWCFICALGGTLICCEYCPTSFHAECLNIKPPEGGYMCEDCETGRLPLYGEMVWVKLGHYRWWPGIILHPCEIPENILAVKHSPGEFVVRFFGQYDHYWVNRGRVFPFQEGDSGKISSQKSKIDAAFTMAIEHAQRACEILKSATSNDEESLDIASSLLPPHYVKLRVNKPCGALCGRRIDEESSLTQCECSPDDEMPCGPYSHCLNRMLLTECGPTCRAGDRCHNRAFEKRLYPKLVPYRTPYRGWGLKTLEDIKAGQFVIEYVGELIDEEEFQRRMRRKHEIRDENFYFLTLDKERMIDAGPKGNLARFMNHCCEPNCETQKWTVLGDVRVGLFALYDIPANSEVTFNYNLESAGIEKKRCLCGAKRCSGYIGAKLKQAEQPKKAKRPYNRKRKVEDSPSTSKVQVKPKPKLGRPPKPKELTDIEKDLLIIKNATNGISSDSDCSGRLSSIESMKDLKASKRKRVGQSTEELSSNSNSPSMKKIKLTEEKSSEVCD